MIPAFINWSSGKDACFALWTLRRQGVYDVRYLFTTLNAGFHRVSMHGVREVLLDEQARQLGIPLKKAYLQEHASMEDYNRLMQEQLEGMLQEDIRHAVFGDIFLEDLRLYREAQLAKIGMQGVFPIWKQDSRSLLQEIIAAGFKAIIVCANARYLDASFAGRLIDEQFLADLPPNVDPCGENGEFHTFVYDGPLFKAPVAFTPGDTVERSYAPSGQPVSSTDKRPPSDEGSSYSQRSAAVQSLSSGKDPSSAQSSSDQGASSAQNSSAGQGGSQDGQQSVNWDNHFYFKELLPVV